MKEAKITAIVLGAGIAVMQLASVLAASDPVAERYWAQWRGPHATGVSRTADPPIEWSETKNVRWKVQIPGRGSGSPVVWENRIFLMTAIPVGIDGDAQHAPRGGVNPRGVHRFVVMAIDRRDGSVIWERNVREAEPHEGSHVLNGTWASNSAVTDGERVYAFFESQGMYAFDMDGNLLWQKELGQKFMRNQFGEGTTPALYGDRLVVVWDHLGGQSFIVVLDKHSGDEIWRENREEIDTWATPLVVEVDERPQVIVPGRERLKSYDLETGRIVWESAGLTMNPIPSPVYEDGMVFAMSGFQGNRLRAIRLAGARGDITETDAHVWTLAQDTPYVPSPLLYDGILYFLKTNSGILSAFDAKTGNPHYQNQRLDSIPNVFASPVGAQGRVYLPGREGATIVLKHGPAFEVLATNELDDGFDASPALVDNEIILRGQRFLYSIAEN